MTTPKETTWDLEPHTRVKHQILKYYLSAWFPILGSAHPRVDYIDGFSGPGRYKTGEDGSPLIALDAARASLTRLPPEVHFFFIDDHEDRLDHLTAELAARESLPQLRTHVLRGSFDEQIVPVMQDLADHNDRPVFAFIDPFGFAHMPFSIVQNFLDHEHGEVLVTFMVDAMNRFLAHPDDQIVQHIVDAFGTENVASIAETSGGIGALRDLYGGQLTQVAKFVRHFEMRDADDRVIYYLFFATNHRLGHIKMKEAMWQVDPGGEYRFSDATNPNQLVMFTADVRGPLSQILRDHFDTMHVTGQAIHTYVEDETGYLKRHMDETLRQMEQRSEVAVSELKAGGQTRKAGSYPDDCLITFGLSPKATGSDGEAPTQIPFDW
jgi:three-Cys-motif partner protein